MPQIIALQCLCLTLLLPLLVRFGCLPDLGCRQHTLVEGWHHQRSASFSVRQAGLQPSQQGTALIGQSGYTAPACTQHLQAHHAASRAVMDLGRLPMLGLPSCSSPVSSCTLGRRLDLGPRGELLLVSNMLSTSSAPAHPCHSSVAQLDRSCSQKHADHVLSLCTHM